MGCEGPVALVVAGFTGHVPREKSEPVIVTVRRPHNRETRSKRLGIHVLLW